MATQNNNTRITTSFHRKNTVRLQSFFSRYQKLSQNEFMIKKEFSSRGKLKQNVFFLSVFSNDYTACKAARLFWQR
jgi:hypothetical protein